MKIVIPRDTTLVLNGELKVTTSENLHCETEFDDYERTAEHLALAKLLDKVDLRHEEDGVTVDYDGRGKRYEVAKEDKPKKAKK